MILAGPCLFNSGDETIIYSTAEKLKGVVDIFRCKVWGGGTRLDRYLPGIGQRGLDDLWRLPIKAMTEVMTPEHVSAAWKLRDIWIGARNSSNYSLIEFAAKQRSRLFIKRNPGATIEEMINLCDIIKIKYDCEPWLIERGINTLDRDRGGRWAPDLKIAYVLKYERPDLFEHFVIDCSHSAGEKRYVKEVYKAFEAIRVQHFMFEVLDGESRTDKAHVLNIEEFLNVFKQ